MADVGGRRPPAEPAWSAQRIAAALPAPLRQQFQREHLDFLALWQAKAQAENPSPPAVDAEPTTGGTRHKWADLMDDWEL